jgi:23S rRNA (cytosine1962-C5)-methyltransferase
VPEFSADPALALRAALIDPQTTTAFRIAHGGSDALHGCYADVLGSCLLSQSAEPVSSANKARLTAFAKSLSIQGSYHKRLSPNPAGVSLERAAPYLEFGGAAPERFTVLENGLRFELSFSEGYSVGLFLDQRDNRRRILRGHLAADFPLFESSKASDKPEVLNAFAYTCGFSVCAAKAGCHATSLDLSKKYLEWGKRNFQLNQLEPAEHDFIYGDVFDWFRRLEKKKRTFDVILLDPPTFSRSKQFGPFRASKDYSRLVELSLPLLKERGVLFASTNTADWPAEDFLNAVRHSVTASRRPILREHYFPQPPDFPISRVEPAYLKTVWLRIQ